MQTSLPVRKRLSSAQKNKILQTYQRSPLTQKEFAAQAVIGVSTLHSWLRKATVKQGDGGSGFLAVPNLLSAAPAAPTYRIQWPGGLSLTS